MDPGVQLRPRPAFHEHVSPVGPSTADGGSVSLRRTLGGHRRFFRICSLVKELQLRAFCGHLAALGRPPCGAAVWRRG